MYIQWERTGHPVLCLRWQATQEAVKRDIRAEPAVSDRMSIVPSVPLSNVWPQCRRESEELKTRLRFCPILLYYVTDLCNVSLLHTEEQGNERGRSDNLVLLETAA